VRFFLLTNNLNILVFKYVIILVFHLVLLQKVFIEPEALFLFLLLKLFKFRSFLFKQQNLTSQNFLPFLEIKVNFGVIFTVKLKGSPRLLYLSFKYCLFEVFLSCVLVFFLLPLDLGNEVVFLSNLNIDRLPLIINLQKIIIFPFIKELFLEIRFLVDILHLLLLSLYKVHFCEPTISSSASFFFPNFFLFLSGTLWLPPIIMICWDWSYFSRSSYLLSTLFEPVSNTSLLPYSNCFCYCFYRFLTFCLCFKHISSLCSKATGSSCPSSLSRTFWSYKVMIYSLPSTKSSRSWLIPIFGSSF